LSLFTLLILSGFDQNAIYGHRFEKAKDTVLGLL
jgi:hypothetical protein